MEDKEILVSVVDTKTGEVYKHDQLSAVAHIWCAEFGWKIIAEDSKLDGSRYV